MPTYRVSIRRPTNTNPLTWDWAETTVAPDPQTAIANSYQNWVDSGPKPPPQPLVECVAQAIPKTAVEKKS